MRHYAILASLFLAASTNATEPAAPDFKIESIELVTFDGSTGKFGVLPADGSVNLFADLIVKVKVTGPRGAYAPGRQLSIELVGSGKATPLQKREMAGIGMDGASFALAYFPTGLVCSPLTVRARLLAQKSPVAKEVKLEGFNCGE